MGAMPRVLPRNKDDAKVMKTLQALGVRGKNREVQTFFVEMFGEATKCVDLHQFSGETTLGEFCAVFGQTHALGEKISSPVLFGQLFAALVLGRSRYLQRGTTVGPQPGRLPPCELALAIDAFVAAVPFSIVKSASGDNAPGMSSLVDSMNAMSLAGGGGGNADVGSLAALMGDMGIAGSEGADTEGAEAMDAEV